jgi:hypothetical protein
VMRRQRGSGRRREEAQGGHLRGEGISCVASLVLLAGGKVSRFVSCASVDLLSLSPNHAP